MLVTGGAGFIGSNFIKTVMKQHPQYCVINLDKLTYASNTENLKQYEDNRRYLFVEGDIANKGTVELIFDDNSIDCVVNFAAESHVDKSIDNPEEFVTTNIIGTYRLLEATKKFCKGRFLHVSTDEVYGSLGPTGAFTEETAYDPRSPYSASKASSDHFVKAYYHTYGLQTLITNCSNNYGPMQFPEKVIPVIIKSIINKEPIPIYGDGKNVRDWLYVTDHCKAIMLVLEKGKVGETYNIGGNNEWTNINLVNLICEVMDKKLGRNNSKSLISFVNDRLGHDRRYAIDASKVKNELGWEQEMSFEKGIEHTIDWYIKFFKKGNK